MRSLGAGRRYLRPDVDELYARTRTAFASDFYPPASWSVPVWYVNALTGNNGNSGTSPSSPVQTIMGGIVAKWGTTQPILQQTTSIVYEASETAGEEAIILSPLIAGVGNNFSIVGTNAPVGAAFASGAVTAKSRGTPGTLLQIASMPAAAKAGMLVYNSRRDAWATIDSLSGATATMAQPLASSPLTTITAEPAFVGSEIDTWAVSDTLQLYSQPLINLKAFFPVGGDSNGLITSPVAWLENLHIPDLSGVAGNSTTVVKAYGLGAMLSNCRFDTFLEYDGSDQSYGCFAANCWLNGGLNFKAASLIGGASNTATNEFSIFEDISGFDGDVILHGAVLCKGAYSICGFAYCDAVVSPVHGGIMQLEPDNVSATGCQLWGPGSVNLEGPNSAVQLAVGLGLTWGGSLTVSALGIEGVTTGTSYSGGVWTDGVSITTTHLDADNGLQNPRTGNRYSST